MIEAVIRCGDNIVDTIDPVLSFREEGNVLFIANGFHEYDFDLAKYQVSIEIRDPQPTHQGGQEK